MTRRSVTPSQTPEEATTMTSDTKNCIDCGASFKRSRADRTVRCPSCRKPKSVKRACVVCDDTGFVTYGPSAVTGEFETVPCHRCR